MAEQKMFLRTNIVAAALMSSVSKVPVVTVTDVENIEAEGYAGLLEILVDGDMTIHEVEMLWPDGSRTAFAVAAVTVPKGTGVALFFPINGTYFGIRIYEPLRFGEKIDASWVNNLWLTHEDRENLEDEFPGELTYAEFMIETIRELIAIEESR